MNIDNIIEECYNNYLKTDKESFDRWLKLDSSIVARWTPYTKEEFTNKIKVDFEFSERWGLKIEERQLSFEERHILWHDEGKQANVSPFLEKQLSSMLDRENIPTRQIKITYNEESVQIYE